MKNPLNNNTFQTILIGIMSCTLSLGMILGLTYWANRTEARIERPFGFFINYYKYEKTTDQKLDPSSIFDPNDKFTVISINKDSDIAGIIDTDFFFHFSVTGSISGSFYFSQDDYKNKRDLGLKVIHRGFSEIQAGSSKNQNMVEIRNNTGGVSLYRPDINEYKNLYALEDIGDYLYFDSTDNKTAQKYNKLLKQSGYKLVDGENLSIFNLIVNHLFTDGSAFSFLFMNLFLYIIGAAVLLSYLRSFTDEIYIYFQHGAGYLPLLKKYWAEFFAVSTAGAIMGYFTAIWLFSKSGPSLFGISRFTEITIYHIILLNTMYLGAFSLFWNRTIIRRIV